MANDYITGYGDIALKEITPIIHALFSTYRIDPFDESESAVCITFISEEHLPDWSDVRANLKVFADKLKLALITSEQIIETKMTPWLLLLELSRQG